MLKILGVYKIENEINHKLYIGESNNIERRWQEHKDELNSNTHTNNKLQIDWNMYGESKFSFEVLEEIEKLSSTYKTNMQLIYLEGTYIDKFNSITKGYNKENTVQEIISGRKVIMKEKMDAQFLKTLIKFSGDTMSKKTKDMNAKIKETNAITLSKFIDELRAEYTIDFSKSQFYTILESKQIIKFINKSYHINDEYIAKGYFIKGKDAKNNYGYKYSQILITQNGKQFIIDTLELKKKTTNTNTK